MTTIKSFCAARISFERNFFFERARARPSAAINSSRHPYASTRVSLLGTRRPYMSDVSPLSPVLVTIDIRKTLGAFDLLAPARSPFELPVYVARLYSVKRQSVGGV